MIFKLGHLLRGLGAIAFAVAAGSATPSLAQETVNPLELMVESPLGDLYLGNENAPVTVIEYASMTCPHCAAFHNTVFDDFKRDYIDTGKVKFIMREFPLDPFAAAGFVIARCTPGDNGYYNMIDLLFEQQQLWAGNYDQFVNLATQAGFTQATFEQCLSNQELIDGVYWSYDRGVELGVNGTPTFFINGEKYVGEITLEELGRVIDAKI